VSDSQLTDLPKGRSRPFEVYVAVSAIAFLVSYVATYVYSFYLQKMTFDSQFHPGADFPGSLVDPAVHDPNKYNVGVHFFGDFWTTLLRSKESSPYLVQPGVGGSSYPPFAQFLYEPLTWIPYPLALVIFLVGTTALIVFPFWRALRAYEPHMRAMFIVIGVILTYPFLFSLDRGNNIGLTVGFLLLGVLNFYENRTQRAAIYFAIAAALKIYPVFFLLIFVSRRQWKAFGSAVFAGTCMTLVPLMTYTGGFVNNIRALYDNSRYFRDAGEQIALNHSLYAWFLVMRDKSFSSLKPLFVWMLSHYNILVIVVIVSLCIGLLIAANTVTKLALAAILNCLLIPITYGYTHTVYLVPVIALILDRYHKKRALMFAVALALLLVAKPIPFGPPTSSWFNYLSVPLQLLFIVVLALGINSHRCLLGKLEK
jgi:hypothetical protein